MHLSSPCVRDVLPTEEKEGLYAFAPIACGEIGHTSAFDDFAASIRHIRVVRRYHLRLHGIALYHLLGFFDQQLLAILH